MSEEGEEPQLREHLHEMRKALGLIGRDIKTDVEDAPHLAKEGTKNAFARAAGIRRGRLREWEDPSPSQK